MQRRSRFRHRLIRWLGGAPSTTELPALTVGPNGELVLPAPDPAQQMVLAGRYYSHAEELLSRGAAELSAPYFRQAYALLRSSLGDMATVTEQPSSTTQVVDLTAEGNPPIAHPAIPADSPAIDPKQVIGELRQQLSSSTVETVAQESARLRNQGVNLAELDHLDGLIQLVCGNQAAAAQSFRMALAKGSNHYGSLVSLSGLVLAEGRLDEAQALLQKALTVVNPKSVEAVPALTNLSLVHQAAGRAMDEALLVLEIHRLKPGHLRPERLLQAAGTLEQMAEEPAAIELLQWLDAHHSTAAVMQQLATLLERRGDYQAAALVYRRLLQPQPTPAGGAH